MTMHTGLQLSFRGSYVQSGRADLVDQVPEVESQDAAYARWQSETADPNVVEQVEVRYREALGLEGRAVKRLASSNRRFLSKVGALIFILLAAALWWTIYKAIAGGGEFEGHPQTLGGWLWWAGQAVVYSGLALAFTSRVYKDVTKSELKRAIGAHEALFAEHPRFANAACRLAYAWEVDKAIERSLDAAVRASEADPEFEMPYFCAGLALKILKRPDEAAVAYRKAIALNPKFAAARDNLGLILVDNKDFEGAVEQFTAMLRDFPGARNANRNLSLAEKRFTRHGHTRTEFQALRLVMEDAPSAAQVMGIGASRLAVVPDVEAASWRHPYHFSGRLPLRALALMVGMGVAAALIAGGVGYFGGAVSRWIGIHAIGAGFAVVNWLSDMGQIGHVTSLGVGLLVWLGVILVVGVLYPVLIGSFVGGGVALGAMAGKCRKPWVAGLIGFLAGGLAYAAFVGTAVLMNAPLHESSRIAEGVVEPPLSYGLMVIDGLIVLVAAELTARSVSRGTPYCELCEKWYGQPKTTTIPMEGALHLVEALASGSAGPLQAVPIRVTDPDRIQLDLSRCECGRTDYNLVATVHWDELKTGKEGKTSTESKTRAWFSTTLPASLGAEIERWWTSQPLPAAV